MKATLFSRVPCMGPAPGGVWPVPAAAFSPEAAEQSMDAAFEQFQLADELGFDWITLAAIELLGTKVLPRMREL